MNAHGQTTAKVHVKTFLEAIGANRALIPKNLISSRGGVLHQLNNGIFFWVSHSKQNSLEIIICKR